MTLSPFIAVSRVAFGPRRYCTFGYDNHAGYIPAVLTKEPVR